MPGADGVVRDEIHVGGKSVHQLCEKICLIGRIVNTSKEAIFDVDDPAGGGLISPGSIEYIRYRPPPIRRNNPAPRRIIRRMQRKSEINRIGGSRQRIDPRNDSHSGNGDMPPAKVSHVRVRDAVDRGKKIRQIMQRLPHSHENERCQSPAKQAGLATQVQKLLHDLAGGEIAIEPAPGAAQKIASHRASHLRGDASSRAIDAKAGHQHRFHSLPVSKGNQQLDRPIGAAVLAGDGRLHGLNMVRELFQKQPAKRRMIRESGTTQVVISALIARAWLDLNPHSEMSDSRPIGSKSEIVVMDKLFCRPGRHVFLCLFQYQHSI